MKTTESLRTFSVLVVHHVVVMGDDYCPNQTLLRGSGEHLTNQISEKFLQKPIRLLRGKHQPITGATNKRELVHSVCLDERKYMSFNFDCMTRGLRKSVQFFQLPNGRFPKA
jgi:hypothetical protein